MSAISAAAVRTLRESTGAGMMECKKALVECDGDMERAADFLRVKSGVKAGKISSRAASEGRIAFAAKDNLAGLVEVNCETDFVARGGAFAAFCENMARLFVADSERAADSDKLRQGEDCQSEKLRRELVMQVGENVSFGRTRILRARGKIASYLHTGDKIAAMADYAGGDETLAREICMHIAAMRPDYLSLEEVSADEMQKQRDIFAAQAAETGKPPPVAQKIAEGRLQKHLAERVLLLQPFVKDGDKAVGDVLKAAGMTMRAFRRLEVGAA